MKGLLKNLGLLLILVGVIILIACSLTGEVNNNAVLGGSIVCFPAFFISIYSPIHYDSGSGVINL